MQDGTQALMQAQPGQVIQGNQQLTNGQTITATTSGASQQQQQQQPGGQQQQGQQQVVMMVAGSGNNPASYQRLALPEMLEEEPLYVNAKQYHRILKRRQARAKLEAEGRIPKERKKYLHESRHLHALKRVRGEGGKFNSNFGDTPEQKHIPGLQNVEELEQKPNISSFSSTNVDGSGPSSEVPQLTL